VNDAQIEAFADLIHDAAIQYANGHETDFRPVAKQIAEASRRAALEEAAAFIGKRADEFSACGNHTADTMARVYKAEADAIRALATETNNG
jgi:hypothetical protein